METKDAVVLNIRNVPEEAARLFKAEAAIRGMTLARFVEWCADMAKKSR